MPTKGWVSMLDFITLRRVSLAAFRLTTWQGQVATPGQLAPGVSSNSEVPTNQGTAL